MFSKSPSNLPHHLGRKKQFKFESQRNLNCLCYPCSIAKCNKNKEWEFKNRNSKTLFHEANFAIWVKFSSMYLLQVKIKFRLNFFKSRLTRNPTGNWEIVIFNCNIAFFFTFFKGYRCNKLSVITPKRVSNGSPENKCQISQNDVLHMKFSQFYLCFHNSSEIWYLSSQDPMRGSRWCYYR